MEWCVELIVTLPEPGGGRLSDCSEKWSTKKTRTRMRRGLE